MVSALHAPDAVKEEWLGSVFSDVPIGQGDVFSRPTAGGGGFGDPLERDPAAVRQDVADDYVSVERAAKDYGVVIKVIDADLLSTPSMMPPRSGNVRTSARSDAGGSLRRRMTSRGDTRPAISTVWTLCASMVSSSIGALARSRNALQCNFGTCFKGAPSPFGRTFKVPAEF